MIDFNPLTFLYDFFFYLVNFVNTIWGFLWNDISIGNLTFKPLYVIGATGGVTILVLWIMKLIKEYIPLA